MMSFSTTGPSPYCNVRILMVIGAASVRLTTASPARKEKAKNMLITFSRKVENLVEDLFLGHIACHTIVIYFKVMECSSGCKHGHHTRPVRIEVRCEHNWDFRVLGGDG